MNLAMEILERPAAARMGWVLLHSLWQGALVGVAFGIARLGLRQCSACARYLAGCVALAALAAGPVLTLALGWTPTLLAGGAPGEGIQPALWAAGASGGSEVSGSLGEGAYSLVHWVTGLCGWLSPLVAAGWALGVCVCVVRLSREGWWVRQLRFQPKESVDVVCLEMLKDLSCRLEISRPVRLLRCAAVEVPTVIGWLRPIILLPVASLACLSPEQLEAILAHELAHVRRLDYVVNAFQCALETLLFYHPVTHWVSRCVREERENCCDDLAVEVCGNRLGYARALATLEESRLAFPTLAFAAGGPVLLNRIRRLLGISNQNSVAAARQLSGLALLGLGLPLILLGVYLMLTETIYEAVARVRIEHTRPPGGFSDPYFIQTEFEVIGSDRVLDRAIETLGLKKEWAKPSSTGREPTMGETRERLKPRLKLHVVPNTALVEIRVWDERREGAPRIANGIAEAYRAFRVEGIQKSNGGGVSALLAQRKDLEGQIAKAQTQFNTLRQELQLPESLVRETNLDSGLTADALRQLNRLRIEAEADYTRQHALLARLHQLSSEDLPKALPTAVPDPLLTALLEQLTTADQRLLLIQHDFGPQHPDVVAARQQQGDLNTKISQRVQGILLGLETKEDSAKQGLDSLQHEIERVRREDADTAARRQPYWEAKRQLEDLQRFRGLLDAKIAAEQVDLTSKLDTVEIVDLALPPLRPTSPNRVVATAIIGLGLLLDVLGLLLLRSGSQAEGGVQVRLAKA